MDSRKHSAVTGSPARISRTVGGTFSVFDGYATGKNLSLTPDRHIVQSWRASDWNDGVISNVSFTFTPTASGCILNFIHSGVPADQVDAIKKGWYEFYWSPIKKYLKTR